MKNGLASAFFMYLLLVVISCAPELGASSWNEWQKYPDAPGLQYRYRCKGPSFTGSAFYHYEIEIFNEYTRPVRFNLVLNDSVNRRASEHVIIQISTKATRKTDLYRARLDCYEDTRLSITQVEMKE